MNNLNLELNEINFTKPYKTRKGLRAFVTGETRGFQLYDTLILSMNDTYLWLKSGGFRTNHTKNCINDNLPSGYRVFQKDFEWYVDTPFGVVDFTEEMVINYRENRLEIA